MSSSLPRQRFPGDVDLVVCSVLTASIRSYLEKGGRVFYLQRGKGGLPVVPVAFWREGHGAQLSSSGARRNRKIRLVR